VWNEWIGQEKDGLEGKKVTYKKKV
jgi:hypothetical protein